MRDDLSEAIQLDIDQQIEAAASKYESVLTDPDAPIEAFINLAFIYWESTDYGFNAAHHLSPEFIQRAAHRYRQILAEARGRFGDNPEISFWEKYFDYVSLGEPPFVDDCYTWLRQGNAPEAIYVHLFAELRDPRHIPHLYSLLRQSENMPTTKNRYIAGVIQALLKRP